MIKTSPTTQLNEQWSTLIKEIHTAKSVHLVTHRMPDSDGLGSQLALFHAFHALGIDVCIYNTDPPPRICRYLEGAQHIEYGHQPPECDLVIALDSGSFERLGMPKDFARHACLMNIDHHNSNTHYGTINMVDDQYCATAAMVYTLLKIMNVEISPPIAQAIYAGILTDTSAFRAETVTANVHRMVAELIDAGADTALAAQHAYASHPPQRFTLLKEALDTLVLHDGHRSAWMHLKHHMFSRCGCQLEDSEGFIEYARSIGGVDVTVFMCQLDDQKWKVTFRGKNQYNVGQLATQLGGGGHRHAAGCTLNGSESEVRARLRMAVAQLFQLTTDD